MKSRIYICNPKESYIGKPSVCPLCLNRTFYEEIGICGYCDDLDETMWDMDDESQQGRIG